MPKYILNSEYYDRVLRMIRKYPAKRKKFLAEKLHPESSVTSLLSMVAKVGRAVNELETAGYIECSNIDLETWKITDKGRVALGEIPENADPQIDDPDEPGLTFLITVVYRCENMLSQTELDKMYNGDVSEAYRNISDNFNDTPDNFGDPEIVKVEIEGQSTSEAKAPQMPIDINDATTPTTDRSIGKPSGKTATKRT